MIKRKVEVVLEMNAYEIAKEFCAMDADEQALFFDRVGKISEDWQMGIRFQLEAVRQSYQMTALGLKIMKVMGE